MSNERVKVTLEAGVAHVRLERPEKMNALDGAMMQAIVAAGEQLRESPSVRAVVVSAAGSAFCAGLDQSNFKALIAGEELDTGHGSDQDGSGLAYRLTPRTHGIANLPQHLAWLWRELSVPVIAAVHGVAFGGGLQLALGADIRFAGPQAKFSVMEIRWGLVPDMAGTQLLRHLVRDDVARELTYTGRIVDAAEALKLGLVTAIHEDPLQAALETATSIASRNPEAIRASKRLLNQAPYVSAEEGLLQESVEQDRIIGSANQIEAVMAEMEQRKPKFRSSEEGG